MIMPGDRERLCTAEQRIQKLQDAALDFYSWSGFIGNKVAQLEADMFEVKRDVKQLRRVVFAISRKLDVNLDDDDPPDN